MAHPFHIAFFEQTNTGSGALAASLLSHLSKGAMQASYGVIDENNTLPTATLPTAGAIRQVLLSRNIGCELSPTPMTALCQQGAQVNAAIGLCLRDENLARQMQLSGMEKAFAVCVYWDLSHLARDEPTSFAAELYDELVQRIGLLVTARD